MDKRNNNLQSVLSSISKYEKKNEKIKKDISNLNLIAKNNDNIIKDNNDISEYIQNTKTKLIKLETESIELSDKANNLQLNIDNKTDIKNDLIIKNDNINSEINNISDYKLNNLNNFKSQINDLTKHITKLNLKINKIDNDILKLKNYNIIELFNIYIEDIKKKENYIMSLKSQLIKSKDEINLFKHKFNSNLNIIINKENIIKSDIDNLKKIIKIEKNKLNSILNDKLNKKDEYIDTIFSEINKIKRKIKNNNIDVEFNKDVSYLIKYILFEVNKFIKDLDDE